MQINVRLQKNFQTQWNKLEQEYGEQFSKLQGLDEIKLSFTDFMDNFVDSDNVANASVDSTSNISQKDIVTMMSEMSKPHQKMLAFHKLYCEIQKMYGFKVANEAFEKMWSYGVYMHDFNTSTFIPYCFAYDLKDIVEKGLYFIEGYNARPAKHLDTFVQHLMEAVAFLARRQAGAVGMPNLIPYLYWFWKKDCENLPIGNPEYYKKQQIQALIYRLNQPWVRQDQCAFTNVSVFDHPYFEAIFGASVFPDGELMIDHEEEIIQFQKDFVDVFNEIREENVFTFPVLTASLLYKDGKFVDEEFAKWACEASRKWNTFNFFTDSTVNSLSNCCRLKSDVTDLYMNSIGGSALKVGSVKVSTLNIARLAYANSRSEKKFLAALRELTDLDLIILDAQRHIIKRNVEKGLLPNFTSGLIDFEHLYSTVGINGIYETMKTFGYVKVDELGNSYYEEGAYELGRKIFEVIHEAIEEFTVDKDYKVNIEQIPGEQAAVKLQKADKLLYPRKVVTDLPLYGNQWLPLGIKATIAERTRICAAFDSYCNGGSIEHINVDAPFDSFDKAWNMLNWVASQGVTYFAFNGKIAQCENYHSYYGSVCPICGKPTLYEYTRTVGFYTPTATWTKERKSEYKLREWMPLNEKGSEA